MDEIKLSDGSFLEGEWQLDIPEQRRIEFKPVNLSQLNNKIIRTKKELDDLGKSLAGYFPNISYERLFRGHSNPKFKLLSSIARGKFEPDLERIVVDDLIEYGRQRWDKFRVKGRDEVLFHLAIGRHLGLKCRLLDWTGDFDAAVAFALQSDKGTQRKGLWILAIKRDSIEYSNDNPFEINDNKIHIYHPYEYMAFDGEGKTPAGISRKILQGGFFTSTSTENVKVPLNKLLKRHPNKNMILVRVIIEPEKFSPEDFAYYQEIYDAMMWPCDPKDEERIKWLNSLLEVKKLNILRGKQL